MLKKLFIYFVCASFLFQSVPAFAASSLTYSYDANGNLVQGDGKYFEYNDANKLVRVRMGNANGPLFAEFFYDHSGQRIKKIENGLVTYYAGKHFENVVNGSSFEEVKFYFAGIHRLAKKGQNENQIYFNLDHLGSTNATTNEFGNILHRMKNYPFGKIRIDAKEKYKFSGKEKDNSTNLYYFEARYYNSDNKYFNQPDIVVPDLLNPQNLNRYAYSINNPISLIDPTGMTAERFQQGLKLFGFGVIGVVGAVALIVGTGGTATPAVALGAAHLLAAGGATTALGGMVMAEGAFGGEEEDPEALDLYIDEVKNTIGIVTLQPDAWAGTITEQVFFDYFISTGMAEEEAKRKAVEWGKYSEAVAGNLDAPIDEPWLIPEYMDEFFKNYEVVKNHTSENKIEIKINEK